VAVEDCVKYNELSSYTAKLDRAERGRIMFGRFAVCIAVLLAVFMATLGVSSVMGPALGPELAAGNESDSPTGAPGSATLQEVSASQAQPQPADATAAAAEQEGAGESSLLGFLPGSQAEQRRLEQLAVQVPQPDKARRWMRALTEEPHVAGTPEDYETALYVRDRLREMGFNAELEEYHVLLNYPVKVSAVQTVPQRRAIALREAGNERDKDSFSETAFPAFHGYGASGDAGGQVVYVNYGRVEDFKKLDELGISVRGRIVLARYGHIFRGLKVQNAQTRGAAGVLLYSDPADDGYMRGDIYPDGPFRPESAIQRGSVQFLSVAPGDPTTPGWASTVGAKRIAYEDIEEIARIPSLPISYAECPTAGRAVYLSPITWVLVRPRSS
jgi:hypothetical protein